jgi:hypothetical protein
MFAIMLYSPRCQHCHEIFKLLDQCPIKDQIKYQNIHEEPIPEDYRKVLTHVPALDHQRRKTFDGTGSQAVGSFDDAQ